MRNAIVHVNDAEAVCTAGYACAQDGFFRASHLACENRPPARDECMLLFRHTQLSRIVPPGGGGFVVMNYGLRLINDAITGLPKPGAIVSVFVVSGRIDRVEAAEFEKQCPWSKEESSRTVINGSPKAVLWC